MSDRDSNPFDFVAAFTLGALFGAGLALLAAPRTGESLRKDLRKDLGKRGKRFRKDARKELGRTGERIKETGGEWFEGAEGRFSDLSAEIADAVESGLQTIRKTVAAELKDIEKRMGRKKGLFG